MGDRQGEDAFILLLTHSQTFAFFLDSVIYTGAYPLKAYSTRPSDLSLFLLPRFTRADHGAHITVGVPAELLCWKNNPGLQSNAVWGTDVYTDDSDIVASELVDGGGGGEGDGAYPRIYYRKTIVVPLLQDYKRSL